VNKKYAKKTTSQINHTITGYLKDNRKVYKGECLNKTYIQHLGGNKNG